MDIGNNQEHNQKHKEIFDWTIRTGDYPAGDRIQFEDIRDNQFPHKILVAFGPVSISAISAKIRA